MSNEHQVLKIYEDNDNNIISTFLLNGEYCISEIGCFQSDSSDFVDSFYYEGDITYFEGSKADEIETEWKE